MPSNYQQIISDNLYEHGHGTKLLQMLARLHPSRTHFIYELLQNAEDAKATLVRFSLFSDRLEVEHNGRPFNEADVRGICGVADSTKEDDLTQIGRFGLGFKSVYAFTSTPFVYSGSERFRIDQFIRPSAVDAREGLPAERTLFVLPFDRLDVSADQAHAAIARGLQRLGPRVLLFLRNVTTVISSIDGGTERRRQREVWLDGKCLNVRVHVEGDTSSRERWQTFERALMQDGARLAVEIAFHLEESGKTPTIIRESTSELVAFFPTDRETGMGFLVQGPYRTTAARDSVPEDDPFNQTLVNETSDLIIEALRHFRETEALTPLVLETMPLDREDFPEDSLLRPIFDSVRDALTNEELLPDCAGGFVSAGHAFLPEGRWLPLLINHEQLQQLVPDVANPRWLEPRIRNMELLPKYLINELGVQSVGFGTFLSWVTDEFLSEQSDDWLVQFYSQLLAHQAQWHDAWPRPDSTLRRLALIRLADGTHTRALNGRGEALAYLPPDGETTFPVIRLALTEVQEARELLHLLGLAQPDVVDEVFQNVLPRYEKVRPSELTKDDLTRDLALIERALSSSSRKRDQLANRLRDARWVRATNGSATTTSFQAPSNLYVHTPLLDMYFAEADDAWFIDDAYIPWLSLFTTSLGTLGTPRVSVRRPDYLGFVPVVAELGHHQRGVGGFDPAFYVDGLEEALQNPTLERSAYVWNALLAKSVSQLRGTVESSSRQSFVSASRTERCSRAGALARELPWLPAPDGSFLPPDQLSITDLPEIFERNTALASVLGMRVVLVEDLAREAGIREDLLSRLIHNPEAQSRVMEILARDEARLNAAQRTDVIMPGVVSGTGESAPVVPTRPRGDSVAPTAIDRGLEHAASDKGDGGVGSQGLPSSVDDSMAKQATRPQSRLPVYVAAEEAADTTGADAEGRALANEQRDAKAMNLVMEFEERAGRIPTRMPHENPGFDVKSEAQDGDMRFIEVKATGRDWGKRGVGLTRTQFEFARQNGEHFWVYVVEGVDEADTAVIHPLRNPVTRATSFLFDSSWRLLAESEPSAE